jgi:hypothetical protein
VNVEHPGLGMAKHTYNPSDSGGRDQEDHDSRLAQKKVNELMEFLKAINPKGFNDRQTTKKKKQHRWNR